MSTFVEVCASAELKEGTPRVVNVGTAKVALARVGGRVYAVDNQCPHREGELGRGDLEGFHLYCPLHAWVFDLRDGRAFFPRGAEVACFEVREEGGRVLVSAQGIKPSALGRWP